MKSINIDGQKFGRLTAIRRIPRIKGEKPSRYLFRCDCGKEIVLIMGGVVFGTTTSCGCYHKEMVSARFKKHGASTTPEYRIWVHMRQRCSNPNDQDWADYGGRGITVCPEWEDFAVFLKDAGPRPTPKHSIDRIDCNGNYEPGNIRWVLFKVQANNKRSNVYVTHNDITLTISEWADRTGLPYMVLWKRLFERKWNVERAITTPKRN